MVPNSQDEDPILRQVQAVALVTVAKMGVPDDHIRGRGLQLPETTRPEGGACSRLPDEQVWEANTMRQEGGRIMIVDDSPTVRAILRVGLHRAGFEVECHENGGEALRSLKDSKRQILPDLIILDVMLPRYNGYEVVDHLKRHPALSGIVVVMLSGRKSVLDLLKGRLVGANVYLTKPFRIDDIVRVVREQLKRAQVGSRD